jgi:hypothetical protein
VARLFYSQAIFNNFKVLRAATLFQGLGGLKFFQNFLRKRHFLALKVKNFLKNGILGGAFYENFEWVMYTESPP